MLTPSTATSAVPGGRGRTFLISGVLGTVLLLAAWLNTGYAVYTANHAIQIPLVHLINDPSLYPNDPFARSLHAYASPLWYAVAWLSRFVPLEVVLVTLFFGEKVLLLVAAAALGRSFQPDSSAAPWAAAAVCSLGLAPFVGAGYITPNYLEHTGLAVALFMLALAALLAGRPFRWGVCLALGFVTNPLYGPYAVTYSAAGVMALGRRRLRDAGWRRWAGAAMLAALLVLPSIIWLCASGAVGKSAPNYWSRLALLRFPWHLNPLTQPAGLVQYLLLLAAALVLAGRYAARKDAVLPRFVAGAGACSLAWVALAFVGAYVVRWPPILLAQPARGTDLWYCIAALFIVTTLARQVERGGETHLILASVVGVFLLPTSYAPKVLAGIALVAFGVPYVRRLRLASAPPAGLIGLIVAFAAASGAVSAVHRLRSHENPVYAIGATPAEVELATWARAHTAESAAFLVPPDMEMFRALSQRAVFGTWRDGGAILWDKSFTSTWRDRMVWLGVLGSPLTTPNPRDLAGNPLSWDDAKLAYAHRHYHMSYAVVPYRFETHLPVAFTVQRRFKVLDLRHSVGMGAYASLCTHLLWRQVGLT